MLFSFVMLSLGAVFSYLAYDAARLSTTAKDVPWSLTAKGLGLDVTGVPLVEQERIRRDNIRYGLGDLSQAVWFFIVLAIGSFGGAIYGFWP